MIHPIAPHPRRSRRSRHSRREQRAVEVGFPHAVELLVLGVRSGLLPVHALALVAPHVEPAIGRAFDAVGERVAAGERFADALGALVDELGPVAVMLVDTLAAADRYGTPLGPLLDRLAAEAHDHRRRAAEARARQLPVRLSAPMVLCTLPSFVFLAIAPLIIGAISSLST